MRFILLSVMAVLLGACNVHGSYHTPSPHYYHERVEYIPSHYYVYEDKHHHHHKEHHHKEHHHKKHHHKSKHHHGH